MFVGKSGDITSRLEILNLYIYLLFTQGCPFFQAGQVKLIVVFVGAYFVPCMIGLFDSQFQDVFGLQTSPGCS